MNKGFRLIAGLLVLPTLTWASRYTLHHRISPSSSWSTRGVITLSEVSGGSPSYEDLTGKVRPWDALAGTQSDPTHLYQLAITPESAKTVDAGAPMTFARVCLLDTDSEESITIHAGPQSELFALSYDLVGVDVSKLASNGCPSKQVATPATAKAFNIQVARPEAPLSPLAPSPPPVKADGSPLAEGEELPKEKSFVAKYWYYFIPILLLMAIPTELADKANEETEEGAGGENPFQAGGVQKVSGSNAGRGGSGGARKR